MPKKIKQVKAWAITTERNGLCGFYPFHVYPIKKDAQSIANEWNCRGAKTKVIPCIITFKPLKGK